MFTGIITHTGTVQAIRKTGDWVFTVAVPAGFMKGVAVGASIACNGTCLTVIKKSAKNFTVQASAETLSRTTLERWKEGTPINLERALKVGDVLGGHFVSGHVDGLARLEDIELAGESKVMLFSCHPSIQETKKRILSSLIPRERSIMESRFGIGMNIDHSLEELKQQFSVTRERIRQIEDKAQRKLNAKKDKAYAPPTREPEPPAQTPSHTPALNRFIAAKGSVALDGVSLTVNEVKGDHFTVNIIPHTLKETTLGKRKKGDMLNLEIDLIARYLARLGGKD